VRLLVGYPEFERQWTTTEHRMNLAICRQEGRPPENRSVIMDLWSANRKLARNRLRLCQEDEKSSCCTRDGGGPSGAAL
jgi:hypothetical protein